MSCVTKVTIDAKLTQATASLPGASEMNAAINEVYLLHGLPHENVLNILKQGMNERFAGAHAGSMFGQGLYFAENTGAVIGAFIVSHKD